MHVRHRTCDVRHRVVHRTYDVVCTMSYVHDVRHRTCDIVRDVRCRTLTYDIVRHTYDIVRVHLNICRMSEMDIRCRTYMTYDIVCIYRIRHRMYIRCRMSTYDIVCLTYDVVRLLEVVVSAVLKQADPLPTAHANDLCHPVHSTESNALPYRIRYRMLTYDIVC